MFMKSQGLKLLGTINSSNHRKSHDRELVKRINLDSQWLFVV